MIMVMFPLLKAQVKLSDDPRTPLNLYPLKGDVDYSPHTAQSEIILHVFLCLTMHINY